MILVQLPPKLEAYLQGGNQASKLPLPVCTLVSRWCHNSSKNQ